MGNNVTELVLKRKKVSILNVDSEYADIKSEMVDKIMWMYMSGVAILAIANFAKMTVEEVNKIIDVYGPAYF